MIADQSEGDPLAGKLTRLLHGDHYLLGGISIGISSFPKCSSSSGVPHVRQHGGVGEGGQSSTACLLENTHNTYDTCTLENFLSTCEQLLS